MEMRHDRAPGGRVGGRCGGLLWTDRGPQVHAPMYARASQTTQRSTVSVNPAFATAGDKCARVAWRTTPGVMPRWSWRTSGGSWSLAPTAHATEAAQIPAAQRVVIAHRTPA